MRGLTSVLGAAFLLVSLARPARASDPPVVRRLPYDASADVTVTVLGGMALATTEFIKAELVTTCRWCYRDELNGFDDAARNALRWKNGDTADAISNVSAFALAPAAAMGMTALAASHDGNFRRFPVDALLITEATVLALDFNQIAKVAFARERPFVHFLSKKDRASRVMVSDDNLSFFSGHTTAVFALAASSGTVSTLRGYRYTPAVWSVGLAVAVATGYLRIAADKHFATDVVIGAVFGTAIGFGVPFVFHFPSGNESPPTKVASALDQGRMAGVPPPLAMPPIVSGVW